MLFVLRIISESFLQAWHALRSNKLRTLLSLLGVTIGIFCIIGVQSAVDSLQDNVMGSLKKLGDDVVYLSKMPWHEDPGQNYWKYQRRPNPDYDDFRMVKERVDAAGLASYHLFIGVKTAKYRSNSVERAFMISVTYDFERLFNIEFSKGRYHTPGEFHSGSNKVLIGHIVAKNLFGEVDPIGKIIKVGGRKLEVLAVFEKSGKDILKIMDFDQAIVVPYELAKKIANVKATNFWGGSVNIKAAPGYSVDDLKDELTGALRKSRRLKPKEKNNFALNTMSILADLLSQFFGTLNVIGIFIGGFSMLVGMFSVANIMFVSVKERTNIIGIKKALGAKKRVILLEFLIESVALCLIGGAIGLAIAYFLFTGLKDSMPYPIYLDWTNVLFGLVLSVFVGILSGFIPAFQAARMDPVEAIRA